MQVIFTEASECFSVVNLTNALMYVRFRKIETGWKVRGLLSAMMYADVEKQHTAEKKLLRRRHVEPK